MEKALWYLFVGTRGEKNRARLVRALDDRPMNANQLSDELQSIDELVEKHPDCPEGHIQVGENEFQDLDYYRALCWEDSRLLGTLLAKLGMGIEEVWHWLNIHCDDGHSPLMSDIKNSAAACGLLEGSHVDYLTRRAENWEKHQRARGEMENAKSMENAQSSDGDGSDQTDSPSPSSHTY